MRRIILSAVLFLLALGSAFAGTIRVTTWNLEWFPSGTPNIAAPEVEQKRINDAARIVQILNPDVLLLQEVRDWDACQKLADAIPSAKYQVLVCSAFKEGFGSVVGRQQVAILSKEPAQAAWSENWKSSGRIDPPRGFAFASVRFGTQEIGFYSVHLKSNLLRGDNPRDEQKNILKREIAALQIGQHAKQVSTRLLPSVQSFVVGGDFNTNGDDPAFTSEGTFTYLQDAGFKDAFTGLQPAQRITHPGKGRYPATTFDYLFLKNLKLAAPPEILHSPVSDHWPVTCEVQVR